MTYARRNPIARLESRIGALARKSDRLATYRLVMVIAAIVLFTPGALGVYRFLFYSAGTLSVIAFFVLLRSHLKVDRTLQIFRSRLTAAHRQHATSQLLWSEIPSQAASEATSESGPPFLSDLDITGKHSLLQLLDWTVSTTGRERLLDLFRKNHVADVEIRRRTALVAELRALRVLRYGFVSRLDLFPGVIEKKRLEALLGESLLRAGAGKALTLLLVLQVLLLGTLAYAAIGGGSPLFLVPVVLLILGHRYARKSIEAREAYESSISILLFLEKFAEAAFLLEKHSTSRLPGVREILEPFHGGDAASVALRKLNWIAGALGVRQNFIAHALVHILFPWDAYWTVRLQRLKEKITLRMPEWENALAEFEAFLSIAQYWDANPSFLPARLLSEGDGGTFLRCRRLRHPLLPVDRVVSNDLELKEDERCALITGSNMSGKSTFLRATGVNFLLARAGAPVAAEVFEFRNAPLYSSLRVSDSLDEGLSSFYAETKRLAEILKDARKHPPVFFLIDEIFRGTNNRERLIGSRAFIREVTRLGCFGLVTTHDLELCSLEQPASAIANYHFREEFRNGVMSFSYQKLRGPSPTTNALEVMRLSGLPVE